MSALGDFTLLSSKQGQAVSIGMLIECADLEHVLPICFSLLTAHNLPCTVDRNKIDSLAYVVQVALNQSALAEDGSAAKIQAAGSNKAKLRDGTASFTDVSILADVPGEYQIRVAAASRKHTMEDATTMLQLASSNTVTAITLMPESPAAGEESLQGYCSSGPKEWPQKCTVRMPLRWGSSTRSALVEMLRVI